MLRLGAVEVLRAHEDAKFRLAVRTGWRHRGVEDIYIASMDGLKGLPEVVSRRP